MIITDLPFHLPFFSDLSMLKAEAVLTGVVRFP